MSGWEDSHISVCLEVIDQLRLGRRPWMSNQQQATNEEKIDP